MTHSKKNYKRAVVNQVIVISITIILVVSLISVFIILNSKNIGRYAVLINEAGKIRGGIQRIVKLELLSAENENLIAAVDQSMLNILKLEAERNFLDGAFNSKYVEDVERDWAILKILLRKDSLSELLVESERTWHSTYALVNYAEKRSLSAISFFYVLTFILFGVILALAFIILVTKFVIKDRIVYQSDHDSLTGLYNRHFFYQALEKEFAIAKRSNHGFAVFMCDIDHFKRVNDTWGHDAGDKVLREVSLALTDESREIDIVARYGGEEFVIFMLTRSKDECMVYAERLRSAVEKLLIMKKISVTISIGVCMYRQGLEIEDMLKNADAALYQAKAEGRNCVRVFEG